MTTTNFNKEQLINVPIASETVQGLVERATDTEATTGTDTARYITPKQLKDNTTPKSFSGSNSGSGTWSITHGLGRVPKAIKLSCWYSISNNNYANFEAESVGFYNGTNYDCYQRYRTGAPSWSNGVASGRIGYISEYNNGNDTSGSVITVTTFNSTTITFTNTFANQAYSYVYLLEVY